MDRYISNMTASEQQLIAEVLKRYFPWLGNEAEEDISGADVISDLSELYSALPQVDGCAHVWTYSGTAYGGDDERYHGDGRCICSKCGADGDS